MTAIEFMRKQLRKCEIDLHKAQKRGAAEEEIKNLREKISFYEQAVRALGEPPGRTCEFCEADDCPVCKWEDREEDDA